MNQAHMVDDDDEFSLRFNYSDNNDEDNGDERISYAEDMGIDVSDSKGRDIICGVHGGESERTNVHILWELTVNDQYGFVEPRIIALSTSYHLSSLMQGTLIKRKEALDIDIGRFTLENKLSLYIFRSNKMRLEVYSIKSYKGCKFGFKVS